MPGSTTRPTRKSGLPPRSKRGLRRSDFRRLPTARHLERPNLARVARGALLHVVSDVPDGAVVRRIDCRCRVVLPSHRRLDLFPLDQHRLLHRQLPWWIAWCPAGKALPGELCRTAVRVADPDVAEAIDRGACHPAEEVIRREGALLCQRKVTRLVQQELIPTNPSASGAGVH